MGKTGFFLGKEEFGFFSPGNFFGNSHLDGSHGGFEDRVSKPDPPPVAGGAGAQKVPPVLFQNVQRRPQLLQPPGGTLGILKKRGKFRNFGEKQKTFGENR